MTDNVLPSATKPNSRLHANEARKEIIMPTSSTFIAADPLSGFLNTIHHGDCISIMDRMPKESIGAIVTSPPYNLKNSTGNGMKDGRGGKWSNAALINGYSDHADAMPHDEYVAWQRNHRFGTSSESIDQLQLALENSEIAVAKMTAKLRLPDEGPKDKPKRRPIPDHIPRMEVELTTGDDNCAQCGGGLRRLGEDVTEELEYVPGRFIVNRIVRPRFACSGCETFTQAALPSRPIDRGRPGPGLLAHVLVNKYADHLPLYRQSQIFERDGIDIDRSTLADWVGKSTALLEPLADAIGRHVLAGQAIFADDTPVKMLAPGTGKTATARLWAYGRDERPWGSDTPPASWYQFSPDRKGQHPKDHLARYQGWMHADGYAGFEDLYRSGDIHEVACMAHVRRKFVDIHRSQGSAIADEAIRRIAQLYAVEKEARGSPPDRRVDLRQAKAKPDFDDLEIWLHAQLTSISGKSPLAGAIRYALTRMARLRPYLDHGILELDNNTAERAM